MSIEVQLKTLTDKFIKEILSDLETEIKRLRSNKKWTAEIEHRFVKEFYYSIFKKKEDLKFSAPHYNYYTQNLYKKIHNYYEDKILNDIFTFDDFIADFPGIKENFLRNFPIRKDEDIEVKNHFEEFDSNMAITYLARKYAYESVYKNYLSQDDDITLSQNPDNIFNPQDGSIDSFVSRISYDNIYSVEKFKEFEKRLFEYEYIDSNYKFISSRGNKKELAAIIHIIINYNYFKKPNELSNKKFITECGNYLANRYNVDLREQLRKPKNLHTHDLIREYYWIDKLEKLK